MENTPPAQLVYNVPPPKAGPAPAYELKKDITGKPPVKRGPQTLKAIRYEEQEDGTEKKLEIEFRVPFAPKSNCKHCYGRGYVGFDSRTDGILVCRKCFPMRK